MYSITYLYSTGIRILNYTYQRGHRYKRGVSLKKEGGLVAF